MMTTVLEVFAQKEAPVSNLAGKKMRSTRNESSSLLYRVGFCTYVGMNAHICDTCKTIYIAPWVSYDSSH